MTRYKKRLPYLCVMLLALGCIGCKREARQDTAGGCVPNNRAKAVAAVGKPVAAVVFDDKALAFFTKQKTSAVYCVAMGAS